MLCIKQIFSLSIFFTLALSYGVNVQAQGFGADDFSSSTTFGSKDAQNVAGSSTDKTNVDKKSDKNQTPNDNNFFIPEKDKPKAPANPQPQGQDKTNLQNAPKDRGRTTSIQRIYKPGEKPDPKEDNSLIFLMSDQFKLNRSMGGRVSCDIRFIVLTKLTEKLSNLSVRLKWPKIGTTLSFYDVTPNVATSFNYTLIGDGCYTMDKAPNIVVNRCRVKGLSQAQCAKKIRWLKQ